MILVMFALAPCAVKQNLYAALDAEVEQAANKTRTTTSSFSSCSDSFSPGTNRLASKTSSSEILVAEDLFFLYSINSQYTKLASSKCRYRYCIAANAPPKYILFRQLKVNAA